VPDERTNLHRMCRHCGAMDSRKLGVCSVCGLAVCEKCGDIQHSMGEKRILHHTCLKEDDSGFSMIKFVR